MTNGSKKKLWVSELIGNDYKNWKNEFVILDCGTGCGKSYFCIHVLGNYAKLQKKKILYLCNRVVRQIKRKHSRHIKSELVHETCQ